MSARGACALAAVAVLACPGSAAADDSEARCAAGEAPRCATAAALLLEVDEVERALAMALRGLELGGNGGVYAIANLLRARGEGARAADVLRRGCDKGDPSACHELGFWLTLGYVVPRDAAGAVAALDRGCALSRVGAGAICLLLASRLRHDEAVPHDEPRALAAEARAARLLADEQRELDALAAVGQPLLDRWLAECTAGHYDQCTTAATVVVRRGQLDWALALQRRACQGQPQTCTPHFVVERVHAAGQAEAATAFVRETCRAGNAGACALLVGWLSDGRHGPKDLVEAERLATELCQRKLGCSALWPILEQRGEGERGRALARETFTQRAAEGDPKMLADWEKRRAETRARLAREAEKARIDAENAARVKPFLEALAATEEEAKLQASQRRPLDRLDVSSIEDLREREHYRTRELRRLNDGQVETGQAWIARRRERQAALQALLKELGLVATRPR